MEVSFDPPQEAGIVVLSQDLAHVFRAKFITREAARNLAIAESSGEAVLSERVVVNDGSQVGKGAVNHTAAFADCLYAVRVPVTSKSSAPVPYRGLREVHPV